MKTAVRLTTILLGLCLVACTAPAPVLLNPAGTVHTWATPGTWTCSGPLSVIFGCRISITVVPNANPAPDQGGPGLCQGHLDHDKYVVRGTWERHIYWVIDSASQANYQFADTDGVVIDRNREASSATPAFVDGRADGGPYRYHYKSTGRATLDENDSNAPGFRLNLVNKAGKACGLVDPPIVNQP